jgi:predicted TIM-barrel fold metal-dependent hydrolase
MENRTAIDVHAHYFPSKYLDTLARFGSDQTDFARRMAAGDEHGQLEARLELMNCAGVRAQVLSVSSQLPYFEDRRRAADAASLGNDLYAETVARHPERLKAFAVVPLPHLDASLAEMERALDTLKMVGVTAGITVLGRSLADEAFEPFFAELNRRQAVLFVHPAGEAACSPLIQQHQLTWPIGAPIEDTIFAAHLVARQIPARYPDLKIVIPHLGGALPLLVSRLDHQAANFVPDSPKPPSAILRALWYDTVAHGSVAALRCACEVFGADRMLFGTDYPYQTGEHYQRAVSYISEAGLHSDAVAAILSRTSETLFPPWSFASR